MKFLFGRKRQKDLADEIQSHLDMAARERMSRGESTEDAMAAAHREFGNAAVVREVTHDQWGWAWLEDLWHDVRYGVRLLRKNPGFTVTALFTLALGIGASVTIFTVVNAVLIRTLPYGDASRLVYMWTPLPRYADSPREYGPSFADVFAWQSSSRSFTTITAFRQRTLTLNAGGDSIRAAGAIVLGNFFETLQSSPLLGRAIDEHDARFGAENVAVISHSFWDSQFKSDPAALGKMIQVNGDAYRIVGIMPPGFVYPHENDFPMVSSTLKRTEIWVPAALTPQQQADRMLTVDAAIGRLAPGVTLQQAQSEMSAIESRLDALNLPEMRGMKSLLVPFIETAVGPVRPLMRLLSGAVILVLLIACGNVANLLMARAITRSHEMGMRTALGAPRARLIRQMLTESLLLSAGGGALGAWSCVASLKILTTLNPGDISRFDEISIDGRVLLFAVAISAFTGLAFGLLPALASSRASVNDLIRGAGSRGTTGGSSRLHSSLIVADVALAVVLLAGAGLLIRSYLNVQGQDKGFAPSTLTMTLAADNRTHTSEQMETLFRTLIEKVSVLPGVVVVGATNTLPLDHTNMSSTFRVDGYPNRRDQTLNLRQVAGDYFDAMQIRLISGRYLAAGDMPTKASPKPLAVVVSESFAKVYFNGANPIGGHIQRGEPGPVWSTIVGVVEDVRHSSLEKPPQPTLYEPSWAVESLAIRTSLPSVTEISSVRNAVHDIDPSVLLTDIETMRQRATEATARRRFQTVLLAAFAGIAMFLALVGLYGLLSYTLKRRTAEIGIRMALGAQRGDVFRLIVGQGLMLTAIGICIGLVAAFGLTRLMASQLYGVTATDPMTFAGVAVLLIGVAFAACYIPARRAMKVDPMVALRYE